ncbi:MAG: hypothetical protein PUK75_00365 [bacterium]|nr:hypothetical protein [bacterium]MDY4100526.1 hypothetical protein [Lachnospiraceae bacterium]
MGIGESGQIYKQKEKQEIFHGEEQKTQQSQVQSVRQVQKQKEDPLEQTLHLQQFQVNVQQMDLSEVQQEPSVDLKTQIVVTTPIHETVSAERLLNGEQLSAQKKEQISQQEQQLKQDAILEEHKEQQEESQLSAAYQMLADLHRELLADTDTASAEFQSVKTTFSRLMEVLSDAHAPVKHQQDALFDARQAAVHYYNTHRGHRWSKKGKRRKDLINRIIDSVQEAVVSDETPKLVKWQVLAKLMSDPSPEGFSSKKTRDFAREQAKKEAGFQQVDEYSYRIYCRINYHQAIDREAARLYGRDERMKRFPTGFNDKRAMVLYAPPYQVNAQGEPLTEQDQQIRQKGLAFYEAMEREDLQLRKPFLDEAIQSMLDFDFDRKMLDPKYLLEHYEEVNAMMLNIWYSEQLFSKDRLNKEYMNQMPESVKQQINLKSELMQEFSAYFSAATLTRNVGQNGEFKLENKTFGAPQAPAFVKEFIKNGRIAINPDDSLSEDNPQTYKTKDGYVKPDITINNFEYTSLNVIELLQNMPALTHLNLQEELRRAGM